MPTDKQQACGHKYLLISDLHPKFLRHPDDVI